MHINRDIKMNIRSTFHILISIKIARQVSRFYIISHPAVILHSGLEEKNVGRIHGKLPPAKSFYIL